MVEYLKLNPHEELEFLNSLQDSYLRNRKKKNFIEFQKIITKKKKNLEKEISPDEYQMISNWYHYAILQIPFLKEAKSSPTWIAKKLGIHLDQAKEALKRLVSLGLITKTDGQLKRKLHKW